MCDDLTLVTSRQPQQQDDHDTSRSQHHISLQNESKPHNSIKQVP